jgi:hypothetical protein
MPVKKCAPGCVCGKHFRARCQPGCTCWRHNPSPKELARLRSMAGNRLGQKYSDEHRRKISAALTGKPLSAEHRRKVAAINADPELVEKKARARKARRRPPETYRQVHKRLVCDRGPASNHLCVDCSNPADDWSHSWPTWEDVAQDIRHPRATFSTNLDAYVPRCMPCHTRLDHTPAAWNYGGGRAGGYKLTESDVALIRTSRLSGSALARRLGVSPNAVSRVRLGKTWKFI